MKRLVDIDGRRDTGSADADAARQFLLDQLESTECGENCEFRSESMPEIRSAAKKGISSPGNEMGSQIIDGQDPRYVEVTARSGSLSFAEVCGFCDAFGEVVAVRVRDDSSVVVEFKDEAAAQSCREQRSSERFAVRSWALGADEGRRR